MVSMQYVIGSVVYSILGIVILLVCFVIIDKVTPENLWKELIEKQNKAVAIVAAALIIAVGMIISSAIHG